MVEGDSVYFEQERQKIAKILCDGQDLHWSEVVESLGEGINALFPKKMIMNMHDI